ncbi:hypothetical protein GGR41_000357 [Paenalcaligenes hominis]|uniref:Alpha/beta hydrolase n=2 Tax=Paenalcaligenes hominis TaxID=643674 RepID=A0ABX0WLM3_9BURK|nr:hypothetical protein [Paenalcaligenes hominis]NJB64136.1 hypothetical protein [Paenalcaligenes hominis]GGE75207.1 hypothetical protein GCM10007278_24180 [Paenalcaligenes hominis]
MKLKAGENKVSVANGEFSFYYEESKSPTSKLAIFFPGAYNREKGAVQYQRFSWLVDYSSAMHCISLSDPTINEENDISTGWFQGRRGEFCPVTAVPELINKIKAMLGIVNIEVFFFGSSAGGFSALKASEYVDNIIVVVINPQVYLARYLRHRLEPMLKYSYGFSFSEIGAEDKRFSFSVDEEKISSGCKKYYIFQNSCDDHHVINHAGQLLINHPQIVHKSEVQDNLVNLDSLVLVAGKINLISYADPATGHSPPSRKDTRKIIETILSKSCNPAINR